MIFTSPDPSSSRLTEVKASSCLLRCFRVPGRLLDLIASSVRCVKRTDSAKHSTWDGYLSGSIPFALVCPSLTQSTNKCLKT